MSYVENLLNLVNGYLKYTEYILPENFSGDFFVYYAFTQKSTEF